MSVRVIDRRSRFINALTRHAPVWIVALLAAGVALAGPATQQALRYERAAILAGEIWRLITGQLVHLGPAHLALNLAGLALVYGLFRSALTPRAWSAVLLTCALSTTLGLLWLSPDIQWYVGLSGVLHGMFLAGALAARHTEPRLSTIGIAALALKMLVELVSGDPWQTGALIDGPVVFSAHLYGAVGGLFALAFRRRTL